MTTEVAKISAIMTDSAIKQSAKLAAFLELFTKTPLVLPSITPSADSAANMEKSLFILGTGIDLTGFTPAYIGQVVVIFCSNSAADATITCGSGVTLNSTGNNRATFDDAEDALFMVALSLTRWLIVVNIGAVTLSTV
jgi:hypothetical protein